MSKLIIPKFNSLQLPQGVSFELMPSALARWNGALAAKEEDEDKDATIDIYDIIGSDWMGSGWTAKRVAGILRNNRKKNITVNLNSPGGDLFEGIAIYNLLRDHDGEITTRTVGLAASAASVIAMAGDTIQIARAGFMMIHNVWVLAMGNRNDLRDAADQLETFDDTLASVYAARTKNEKKNIAKLMDKETWFSGEQAIEDGFADELMPADQVEEKEPADAKASLRALDAQLARRGISRNERRTMIKAFKDLFGTPSAAELQDRSMQDAAPKATQDAGDGEVKRMVDSFLESIAT
ncbi:MAG: ATP-dependent Clp protease proteolytic subunit [Sulfuritalea sp.]|nr:ATP-dependent Clp protease proteolytic subunit [Sulfuritalea sp.]